MFVFNGFWKQKQSWFFISILSAPWGYNLHGSRFEGCCWFGIHGDGAPGTDDCHLNSIDGTLARFEMQGRLLHKKETWYLLFIGNMHVQLPNILWLPELFCYMFMFIFPKELYIHATHSWNGCNELSYMYISRWCCIYWILHFCWYTVHQCTVVLVVIYTWFMFFVLSCFHSPCICWASWKQ